MALEDEGNLIEAVVTCEGNLHDPDFSDRFQSIVSKLKSILYTTSKKQPFQVRKIEPWNSVRVTISIPKEAAQKLRHLAQSQQGSNVLRQLGILSVQVEGDQVISLTLAGRFNEPQEVILRQSNESTSSGTSPSISSASSICSSSSSICSTSVSSNTPSSSIPIVPVAGPSGVTLDILSSSTSSAFRSPNVVAPSGESIPFPPKNTAVGPRPLGGPFPFASMTHAAHTMQRSETGNNNNNTLIPPPPPPSVINSTNDSNNNNNNSSIITSNHHANPSLTPATTTVAGTVLPLSVTSGPSQQQSNMRTSSTKSSPLSSLTTSTITTTPSSLSSSTSSSLSSFLTVPLQTLSSSSSTSSASSLLSAPLRKNNKVNSPNLNVVSKPQPVLVTAVVNAKNNSNNINLMNSNNSSSFIPPNNNNPSGKNVVVVVNNTNFSKPAQVHGDAKLNPSQHVQHLQQQQLLPPPPPHHHYQHSKLQTTVLKTSTHTILSKDKESQPSTLPSVGGSNTVVTIATVTSSTPQLTSSGKPRQFLINPLTGHLEPMPSESSSDSEGDEDESNTKRGTSGGRIKTKGSSLSTVKSTITSKGKDNPTVFTTGWDKLSPPKPVKITLDSLKFNRLQSTTIANSVVGGTGLASSSPSSSIMRKSSREDLEGLFLAKENSSVGGVVHVNNTNPVDKVKKLRLKLEKNELLSPASYKLDVTYVKKSEKSSMSSTANVMSSSTTPSGGGTSNSFGGASPSSSINVLMTTGQNSLASSSSLPTAVSQSSLSSSSSSSSIQSTSGSSGPSDVPRVPPLHISLRGKNAAVVVSPRRDDKDLPSVLSHSPSSLTPPSSSSTPSSTLLNEKIVVSVNPSKSCSFSPSSISSASMALAKRTKIRLKSSDGVPSHLGLDKSGESFSSSKKVGKSIQSRPSLSTTISSVSNAVEEREDPLKARLKSEEESKYFSSSSMEFSNKSGTMVNKSTTIISDLISGNHPGGVSAISVNSAAPSLNPKLKKNRRKSELASSSPRQTFISSQQSHEQEVIRPPNSVVEASQLMALLSQQQVIIKEEAVGGGEFQSTSIVNPSTTTITTSVVDTFNMGGTSTMSCDIDNKGRYSTITTTPTHAVPVSTTSAAVNFLPSPIVTTLTTPSVAANQTVTIPCHHQDKDMSLKGEMSLNNSTHPIVNKISSDIPKLDQGSVASNVLEIITTTIPESKQLSESPYNKSVIANLDSGVVVATQSAIGSRSVSELMMINNSPLLSKNPQHTHVTTAAATVVATTSLLHLEPTPPTTTTATVVPMNSSILNQMLTGKEPSDQSKSNIDQIKNPLPPVHSPSIFSITTTTTAVGGMTTMPSSVLQTRVVQNIPTNKANSESSSIPPVNTPLLQPSHTVSVAVQGQESQKANKSSSSDRQMDLSRVRQQLVDSICVDNSTTDVVCPMDMDIDGDYNNVDDEDDDHLDKETKTPKKLPIKKKAEGPPVSGGEQPVLESEFESNQAEQNSSPSTTVSMAAPNSSCTPDPLRLMAQVPPTLGGLTTTTMTTLAATGKPEDHQSGIPGEDSGIDSMDALSEKSPNQGESPARKNENDHHFCDNSSASHSHPPQQQHQQLLQQKNSPLSERSRSDTHDSGLHLQSLESTLQSAHGEIFDSYGSGKMDNVVSSSTPVVTSAVIDVGTHKSSEPIIDTPSPAATTLKSEIEESLISRNQVPLSLPSPVQEKVSSLNIAYEFNENDDENHHNVVRDELVKTKFPSTQSLVDTLNHENRTGQQNNDNNSCSKPPTVVDNGANIHPITSTTPDELPTQKTIDSSSLIVNTTLPSDHHESNHIKEEADVFFDDNAESSNIDTTEHVVESITKGFTNSDQNSSEQLSSSTQDNVSLHSEVLLETVDTATSSLDNDQSHDVKMDIFMESVVEPLVKNSEKNSDQTREQLLPIVRESVPSSLTTSTLNELSIKQGTTDPLNTSQNDHVNGSINRVLTSDAIVNNPSVNFTNDNKTTTATSSDQNNKVVLPSHVTSGILHDEKNSKQEPICLPTLPVTDDNQKIITRDVLGKAESVNTEITEVKTTMEQSSSFHDGSSHSIITDAPDSALTIQPKEKQGSESMVVKDTVPKVVDIVKDENNQSTLMESSSALITTDYNNTLDIKTPVVPVVSTTTTSVGINEKMEVGTVPTNLVNCTADVKIEGSSPIAPTPTNVATLLAVNTKEEVEDSVVKTMDASTSTRTTNHPPATAISFPSKSNVSVPSKDDQEKVHAVQHAAQNNTSVIMAQSQISQDTLTNTLKILDSKVMPTTNASHPANATRKDLALPVLIPAPTAGVRESQTKTVNVHEKGSPPPSLAPILIRPNFQQHTQPRQSSIEVSLPSKMEVKPNVNINVSRTTVPPNVIQLTKAAAANLSNKMPIAVSASHSVSKGSPISVSLAPIGNAAGAPTTVFAIHPNLSHQYHHHQSAITVLPSGHKMVPIKLVTIPKQNQTQLPLQVGGGSNRASPTILETVNLVTTTSRSSSPTSKPKAVVHGNPVQTSPLNLSSVTGTGNLHLVPISVSSATTASGTANPVKVLVSSPMKMQQNNLNLLQSMMAKGQIVMSTNQNQSHPTTIRVVRPVLSHAQDLGPPPPKLEPIVSSIDKTSRVMSSATTTTTTSGVTSVSTSTTPTVSSSILTISTPRPISSSSPIPETTSTANSIYEHVDGVQVLETEDSNEMDELFPFEADIIHDEKDLADVLADENVTVTENGIGLDTLDGPYDLTKIKDVNDSHRNGNSPEYQNFPTLRNECLNSNNGRERKETSSSSLTDTELDNKIDSPIPAMRASSPLYTYSNRSARNSHSATESRSPSPPAFTNSSPSHHTYAMGSSRLEARDENKSTSRTLEQLSIEIPPVDLMAMSPAANTEENRKSTRSTRSNTRLVSPDITAFRSDTKETSVEAPKPTKFTSKPDSLLLRNSPKHSPTGSIKTHSPGIQPSTSTRSSPIPTQLGVHINSGFHGVTGRNSPNTISSTSLGGRGTAFMNKRKRQESDSSSASKDENLEETKIDMDGGTKQVDLNSRPGKRRCSENAAELIKACIGVEDTPKRNSSLIKKLEQQDLKNKDGKGGGKKPPIMSVVLEENEDDFEAADILNRGRGRSNRSRSRSRSSDDRSSSRGSSINPNTKEQGEHKDKTTNRVNNRTISSKDPGSKIKTSGRDSPNSNAMKNKEEKTQSAMGRRSNRNALTKEKSPFALAKTRTNVRKEQPSLTGGTDKTTTPSTSPENGNPRRKTRSSVAVGMSDSSMQSFKRRRISKDAKS